MPGASPRTSLRFVIASVLAASGLAWGTSCAVAPAKPAPPPTAASITPTAGAADPAASAASRFGVHLAGNADVPRAEWTASVPGLGARWLRANIAWSDVERTEGRYDWSIPDAIVQQAAAHQVSLLLQLRGYAGGSEAWFPRNTLYDSSAAARQSGYERFVRETVRRYRATVHTWQIENEVTARTFWTGTIEEYADVLHTAYRVIKAEDPTAQVLLAGIAAEAAIEWIATDPAAASRQRWAADSTTQLDLLLRRSSGAYDILDAHVYLSPDTIPARIEYLRARMGAFGDRKPIWVTETGGPDTRWPYNDSPPGQRRVDTRYREQPAEMQMAEVAERLAGAFGAGAERVFWHSLRTVTPPRDVWDGMALLRGSAPGPGAVAYQQVARRLDAFTAVRRLELGAGVSAYTFATPRGEITVAWSRQPTTISLAGRAGEVTVTDLKGAPSRQPASGVRLTASPVFIE